MRMPWSAHDLVIADGPFDETKEQIAGFLLVDCKDLDEPIELAAEEWAGSPKGGPAGGAGGSEG